MNSWGPSLSCNASEETDMQEYTSDDKEETNSL